MKFYFITKTLTQIKGHEKLIKIIEENNDNCHGKDLHIVTQITVKGKITFSEQLFKWKFEITGILDKFSSLSLLASSSHLHFTTVLPSFNK